MKLLQGMRKAKPGKDKAIPQARTSLGEASQLSAMDPPLRGPSAYVGGAAALAFHGHLGDRAV